MPYAMLFNDNILQIMLKKDLKYVQFKLCAFLNNLNTIQLLNISQFQRIFSNTESVKNLRYRTQCTYYI